MCGCVFIFSLFIESVNGFRESHLQSAPQGCPQLPRGSSQVLECDGEQQGVFRSRRTSASVKLKKKTKKHTSVLAKRLTSALCVRSCQLMASHHVGQSFFAPGLSHANGHVMPLQSCADVNVQRNAETLNLIQKAGHLQNNNQFNRWI